MFTILITACAIGLSASQSSAKQTETKKETGGEGHGAMAMTFSSDDGLFIPGVVAMVLNSDGVFKFDFVSPADRRDPDFKDVDIRKGDVLIMLNGKRVKSVEQLHELFDAIKVGDEVKLGLRRGKDMLIASFPKAEMNQSGGGMVVTETEDAGNAGGPKVMTRTMTVGGPEGDAIPLVQFGAVLIEKDGTLQVGPKLQLQGMKAKEINLAEGDVVLAINGTDVKSAGQFRPVYDKLAEGADVNLKVKRGEETIDVTFAKPSMGGMKVITRTKK